MKAITAFDKTLENKANFLYNKLLEPKSESDILKTLDYLGIKDLFAKTQLVTLYSWKNGIEYNPSEYTNLYDYSGTGVLLPLQFIEDIYHSGGKEEWEPETIPIIGNYKGEYLYLDTNSESDTYKMLLLYSKSALSISPMLTIYDSIESMLETIIECFDSGTFQYMEGKGLVQDIENMFEISKRSNPTSEYWQ